MSSDSSWVQQPANNPHPAEANAMAAAQEGVDFKTRFVKCRDKRHREIEGLWQRNGRFYCQMSVPGKHPRKFPLKGPEDEPVKTVQEAVDAMHELRRKKRQNELPSNSMAAPAFDDYVKHYLDWVEKTKKPKTLWQERSVLKGWSEKLGKVRLSKVSRRDVNAYVLERKKAVGNRTVNMDVLVLRNLLKFAKKEGLVGSPLATDGWEPLRYRAPKRPLFSKDQIEKVCAEALARNAEGEPKYRNGELLADAIRFMLASGARVTSALATHWSDVDYDQRQLHLRETKYDQSAVVDFNAELEAHLKDMAKRRLPDSPYLFPGTRAEGHVGSLRKTFELVKAAAGVPGLRFHDLRHAFISACVMSGVDFMTIARWVGHSDGGVLIGKVYGHIANEHGARCAQKVSFDVAPEKEQPAGPPANVDLSKVDVAELMRLLQLKLQPQQDPGQKQAA
jgi:integrase